MLQPFRTALFRARLAGLALACLAGWALAAEPKGDDCLRCHDKPQFTQKTLHTVPAKGCSGCHVNHETKGEAKLLVSEVPELCYACHAEKGFKAKRQHDPVKQGACLDCHDAHSAQHPGMLINEPIEVCLECHASDLKGKPHVISSSLSGKGHPLGNEPEMAKVRTRCAPAKSSTAAVATTRTNRTIRSSTGSMPRP